MKQLTASEPKLPAFWPTLSITNMILCYDRTHGLLGCPSNWCYSVESVYFFDFWHEALFIILLEVKQVRQSQNRRAKPRQPPVVPFYLYIIVFFQLGDLYFFAVFIQFVPLLFHSMIEVLTTWPDIELHLRISIAGSFIKIGTSDNS